MPPDIRTQGQTSAPNQPSEAGSPREPAKIKFRIEPLVAIFIFGLALLTDIVLFLLFWAIIGVVLNPLIGALSNLLFFPCIFYLASNGKVNVYSFKSKDIGKILLMSTASLFKLLPLPAITADVGGILAAVYMEDLLNSGLLTKQMLGQVNPIVRSVGGLVSGRRSEIKALVG